jgi:hypothetical protein
MAKGRRVDKREFIRWHRFGEITRRVFGFDKVRIKLAFTAYGVKNCERAITMRAENMAG